LSAAVKTESELFICRDTPANARPDGVNVSPQTRHVMDNNTAFDGKDETGLSLLPTSIVKREDDQIGCQDTSVSAHPDADVSSRDNNTTCDGKCETGLSLLPESSIVYPSCDLSTQASIVYPSCDQNIFLGGFGLANKAELPQLKSATRNQLHREAGGILRRSVRAHTATEMIGLVQRRTKSMRCISFEGSSNSTTSCLVELSPRRQRENSPRTVRSSDSAGVSIRKPSSAFSKQLKPSNVDRTDDSSGLSALAESCSAESTQSESTGDNDSQSSLSLLADTALADLEASQMQVTERLTPLQNAIKRLPAKSKVSIAPVYRYLKCHCYSLFG